MALINKALAKSSPGQHQNIHSTERNLPRCSLLPLEQICHAVLIKLPRWQHPRQPQPGSLSLPDFLFVLFLVFSGTDCSGGFLLLSLYSQDGHYIGRSHCLPACRHPVLVFCSFQRKLEPNFFFFRFSMPTENGHVMIKRFSMWEKEVSCLRFGWSDFSVISMK